MERRRALQLIATSGLAPGLLAQSSPAAGRPARTSPKKGWAGDRAASRTQFGCTWWYNWGCQGRGAPGYEFVPQVKGNRLPLVDSEIALVNDPDAKALLGYNEPERKDQGNVPLEAALDAWPRLTAFAEQRRLRVGSPCNSSDTGGGAYLRAFMQGVKARRLKVDFLVVHWYRSADPDAFEAWLRDLHAAYRLPIWVKEFNAMYTGADAAGHQRFLRGALRALERLRFVERYAYFDTSRAGANLLNPDGSPSRLGEIYRAAGD
jgi:hypothetical protein